MIGTSAGAEHACWSAPMTSPCALVLGNESHGLADETLALCNQTVTIPMYGGASSFNVTVAAGILVYEWARQRDQQQQSGHRDAL